MGHESVEVIYMYAHLFPSVQIDMVNDLDKVKEVMDDVS